jgi:large subunit ribosomal protein L33
MAKKKKNILKLECTVCKNINYLKRVSKKTKKGLELKKFCKNCKKHTTHKAK